MLLLRPRRPGFGCSTFESLPKSLVVKPKTGLDQGGSDLRSRRDQASLLLPQDDSQSSENRHTQSACAPSRSRIIENGGPLAVFEGKGKDCALSSAESPLQNRVGDFAGSGVDSPAILQGSSRRIGSGPGRNFPRDRRGHEDGGELVQEVEMASFGQGNDR